MKKNHRLDRLAKKAELVNEVNKLKAEGKKSPLYMDIDAELKAVLQEAYGRNLTRLFEEMAVERLRKDGFLEADVDGKAG